MQLPPLHPPPPTAGTDPAKSGSRLNAGIGRYLFENQLVNLELAGLILTVSMVGAIVIARRRVVGIDESIRAEHRNDYRHMPRRSTTIRTAFRSTARQSQAEGVSGNIDD